ncbi:hypothetical protein HPB47_008309 [Ixodes persulcatus]|uniref:Uncharacterized protein n=1 Tax=Ixodes persulcatus TaxID=34615 RepID=A0AC60P5I3_IXOPE|nr:hypothetical protein HPB47_008309 [Ixodes persulcatus]
MMTCLLGPDAEGLRQPAKGTFHERQDEEKAESGSVNMRSRREMEIKAKAAQIESANDGPGELAAAPEERRSLSFAPPRSEYTRE